MKILSVSGAILFEFDGNVLREAVLAAIKSKTDLSGTDLSKADLFGANLSRAYLSGAKSRNDIVPQRTITPAGNIIGYKKLRNGTICKLLIPANAKRVGGVISRKCRAAYARVISGSGQSFHDSSFRYKRGKLVRPREQFNSDPFIVCGSGIHFFITRQEAEQFNY